MVRRREDMQPLCARDRLRRARNRAVFGRDSGRRMREDFPQAVGRGSVPGMVSGVSSGAAGRGRARRAGRTGTTWRQTDVDTALRRPHDGRSGKEAGRAPRHQHRFHDSRNRGGGACRRWTTRHARTPPAPGCRGQVRGGHRGERDFPDVVLEVDHTTDVRRGRLGWYEEGGSRRCGCWCPSATRGSAPPGGARVSRATCGKAGSTARRTRAGPFRDGGWKRSTRRRTSRA